MKKEGCLVQNPDTRKISFFPSSGKKEILDGMIDMHNEVNRSSVRKINIKNRREGEDWLHIILRTVYLLYYGRKN